MTKQEMVEKIREGLDEMVDFKGISDAELLKINAIRFVENYRIMRVIEVTMDDEA